MRTRIAVTELGRQRLQREALLHKVLSQKFSSKEIAVPPTENLHPNIDAALAWPLALRSVKWRAANEYYFSTFSETERQKHFAQAAEKLSFLHDGGIIHGDLKPSNILLEQTDTHMRVFLGGFAHAVVEQSGDAEHGDVPVLPSLQEVDWRRRRASSDFHRAPELRTRQRVTEASDIYAFGVLLFRHAVEDFEAPFTVNWQAEVADPVIRRLIEAMTATAPNQRPSAKTIAHNLRNIERLRTEEIAEQAALAKIRRENENKEKLRVIRPWKWALGSSVVVALSMLSLLSYSLFISRNQAQDAAYTAQQTRDFLERTLLSADPRTPGVDRDAPVRDVLDDAVSRIATDLPDAPEIQLETLLLIARIQRGLSNFDGQRESLTAALQVADQQLPNNYAARADVNFLLAHNLITSKPRDNETQEDLYAAAKEKIDNGERLIGLSHKAPDGTLVLKAYVKAYIATVQNDFEAAEETLAPVFSKLKAIERPLKRNEYNPVILYAQALLRNQKPEGALATLGWLGTKDDSPDIPDWLTMNRRTLHAQIAGILKNENATQYFEKTLKDFLDLYGEGDTREAGLRSYYGDYLASIGRLDDGIEQQTIANDYICKAGLSVLYCKGTLSSIGVMYLMKGDYDKTIEIMLDVKASFAGVFPPGEMLADYVLMAAYYGKGDEEAAANFARTFSADDLNALSPGTPWEEALIVLETTRQHREAPTALTARAVAIAIDDYEKAQGNPALISWAITN